MILDFIYYIFLFSPTFSFLETRESKKIDSNIYYYANNINEKNNINIKKHVADNMADSGGADVFMVQSKEQNFVIKIENPRKINSEVKALKSLMYNDIGPKLLGQGEFKDNEGDRNGVLIESFVEGQTVHNLLKKLAYSKNPFAYLINKHKLNKALKSLAKELSIFHSLHSKPVHNDLHPGNIFYNPDSNKITLIDFEFTSFHAQLAEEDIAYFLLTFEMYASKFKFSKKKLDSLKATFLDNYKNPINLGLVEDYRQEQIEEFKDYFDPNGNDEEKKLLRYLNSL